MEQELRKKLVDLKDKLIASERLSEEQLIVCKAAFEDITGQRIVNKMLSCGGRLCEVYRRTLINYINKSYNEVIIEDRIEAVKDVAAAINYDSITVKQIKTMLTKKSVEFSKYAQKQELFEMLTKELKR